MHLTSWPNIMFLTLVLTGVVFLLIGLYLSNEGIALIEEQGRISALEQEIRGDYSTGQSIGLGPTCLKAISIRCATYRRTNFNLYSFLVKAQGPSGPVLANIHFPAHKLIDNHFALFRMHHCLQTPDGQYYVELNCPQAQPAQAISVWYHKHDKYDGGQRYCSGQPAEGDLVFRLYTSLSLWELLERICAQRPGIMNHVLLFPCLLCMALFSTVLLIILIALSNDKLTRNTQKQGLSQDE
ncbi:hypothetical protein JXQ70_15030 [bacterium]|nr:hypothetical protein [bacterium]